jgi:hypothetical protein
MNSAQLDAALSEFDDVSVHAQPCAWLVRKKDKLVSKGVRLVVVGRFGIYLINAKKVRSLRRKKMFFLFFFFFFPLFDFPC